MAAGAAVAVVVDTEQAGTGVGTFSRRSGRRPCASAHALFSVQSRTATGSVAPHQAQTCDLACALAATIAPPRPSPAGVCGIVTLSHPRVSTGGGKAAAERRAAQPGRVGARGRGQQPRARGSGRVQIRRRRRQVACRQPAPPPRIDSYARCGGPHAPRAERIGRGRTS